MLDPRILAGTPHRSKSSFEDLLGQVVLMHSAFITQIIAATGNTPARYPMDAGQKTEDLLQAIQAQHVSEARALGISAPPDLQSFDLKDATQFASWTLLLGNDLYRIKQAVGIV